MKHQDELDSSTIEFEINADTLIYKIRNINYDQYNIPQEICVTSKLFRVDLKYYCNI